jgi:hypothetical protein
MSVNASAIYLKSLQAVKIVPLGRAMEHCLKENLIL